MALYDPERAAAPAKVRVQFDFTPEALSRLDELKDKSGAATRAETLRNALRFYEWLLDVLEPDSTIRINDKNDELVSQFRAKLLFNK